jgi:hypothetical protein
MIDKPLAEIGPDDLQRLVANKVPESRSLEYKQALPGGTDGEKKEFLADVSSFANAVGGDLVFGITETREDGKTTGLPESVPGLAGVNTDAETRRLENILRDGIAPRLPSVQFYWVSGLPAGSVLIIRVQRSWAGPHMVTYQQHSRFYSRRAAGKYPLDVFELRQAFLGSGALGERAREFRAERLGRLVAGELPVSLNGGRRVAVHFIPHASLAGATDVDLALAATQNDTIQPFAGDYSVGRTYNLDGFLTYRPTADNSNFSYLQVYRNGILESVTSRLFADLQRGTALASQTFAIELGRFIHRARSLMQALGIEPPASVYVSLIGVGGVALGISEWFAFSNGLSAKPFDRDAVLLRELFVTGWEGPIEPLLKPLLDELWQAAGFARCFDYNEQGQWKPLQS